MLRFSISLLTLLCLPLAAWAEAPTVADAQASLARRDYEDAAEKLAVVTKQAPDSAQAWYLLGFARHALGDIEGALPCHLRASKSPKLRAGALFNAACAQALLGRPDAAFEALRSALGAGLPNNHGVRSDEDLQRLRSDPRFQELLPDPLGPGIEPAPDAFDFWIGEWASDVLVRKQGVWRKTGRLQHRVTAELDGRLIVEFAEAEGGTGMLGYSARCFDPASGRWTALLNWPSANASTFSTMHGYVRHGRAAFLAGGGPALLRYTFSDTGPTRFRWDQASTKDGGTTWSTTMMFLGTRRALDAPPLAVGPTRANTRCPAPAFRALDGLIGTWRGTRTRGRAPKAAAAPAPMPARARIRSVMEGSALEFRFAWGEGPTRQQLYAIAARDHRVDKWVWYELDTLHTRFLKLEGRVGKDTSAVLRGRRGARPYRLTLRLDGDALRLHTEQSADGGRTWQTIWRDALEAP